MQINNKLPKEGNNIVFFDFLFWVVLATIFPAVSGHFNFYNILHIFLYFSAVYYAGEILLHRIEAIIQIPFLFRSGIYIITGSVFCGILFLFFPSGFILYALAFCFFIDVIFRRRIIFSFSTNYFICLLPFFTMLFHKYELAYAIQKTYTVEGGDYYFYTLIVESLKTNQSLSSAVYQVGLPISYSVAPFFAPAQLAKFADISAQFSLWGVYSKIIPVVCFGTTSYVIVKIYETFFGAQPNRRIFNKMLLLVSLMLLFLGPLHLLNLVKLDFKNVLLLGEGYLLPIKSMGFSLSMFAFALIMLLIVTKPKYTTHETILIIGLIVIVSASKLAFFLPMGAFLGTLSILWLFKKQPALFFTLLMALPFGILAYKFTLRAGDTLNVLELSGNGYYQFFFSKTADKYGISGSPAKKILLTMSLIVFMWLSIKLLIFSIAGLSLFKTNYTAISVIVAGIIAFAISMLPAFFINSFGRDSKGNILYDGRYDMPQFVRGGIFILLFLTCVFALYLIYNHNNILVRRSMLLIICLWMIPVAYSYFNTGEYTMKKIVAPVWYEEVENDFHKIKPSLMAMQGGVNSSGYYRGMMLAQSDVHPWFCTGTRLDDGYIFLQRTQDRNIFFQKILDSNLTLAVRRAVADSVRKLGVDCLVASPVTLPKFLFAQKDSLITPIPQTKWFYKFN